MGRLVARHGGSRATLRRAAALAAGALLAAGLAACGADERRDASTSLTSWTIVLDYEPNAVHAGLLRAERAGYFREAGLNLKVIAPSSTADALTQVSRGRAELGLGDLIDVARRNERAKRDAEDDQTTGPESTPDATQMAVAAAVVQEPLSGILVDADGPIRRPAQLAGKKIAVSGMPSDDAVIAAIARDASGPVKTKQITLAFNGLKALHSGQVDATTAYWPADEVTLRGLGTKPRRFTLTDFGHVKYPGLVAFSTRKLAETEPVRVQAFADALRRGTLDVIADQSGAVGLSAVADTYPELDAESTRAQLKNYLPLFGDKVSAGRVNDTAVEQFTVFAKRYGLTKRQLEVGELLLPPGS